MQKYTLHNPYYKVSELLKRLDECNEKNEIIILINLINNNTPLNLDSNIILTDYTDSVICLRNLLTIWIDTIDKDIQYYGDKFNIKELLDLKDLLLKLSSRFN